MEYFMTPNAYPVACRAPCRADRAPLEVPLEAPGCPVGHLPSAALAEQHQVVSCRIGECSSPIRKLVLTPTLPAIARREQIRGGCVAISVTNPLLGGSSPCDRRDHQKYIHCSESNMRN